MRKVIKSISFILAGFIFLSGTAYAESMWAHGNVGRIEYPGDCTYINFGWGLDLEQEYGKLNWIHFPVPSKGGSTWGAQIIRLVFYTGSADAFVSAIHVYNGANKVKEFTGLSLSNGWKDVKFDLGSKMSFNRGMGISVKIGAGVESLSHRFIFSGVGANFVE